MNDKFFQVISSSEFIDLYKNFPTVSETEEIGLNNCQSRILAKPIISSEDLPPFSRSSMDGYALRAKDSFGCSEANPGYLECVQEIEIDNLPGFSLQPGQCARLVTGAALPDGADSVIMQEFTQKIGPSEIEIRKTVFPGENAMLKGEDCQEKSTCLLAGTRLRPQEIGLLASIGHTTCSVYKKPLTGIISTGNELVPVDKQPQGAQIRDVNSYTLSSLLLEKDLPCKNYGIVQDNLDSLKKTLELAISETDLVLLSGGSSVGTMDMTLEALQSLPQSSILAHGVGISPGKPTILAKSKDTPVLGLPGQVASALIVLKILVLPLLDHLSNSPQGNRIQPGFWVRLNRNIPSKQGREDYVRVRIKREGADLPLAEPAFAKSGLLKSLVQAQGLVCIPEFSEGLEADQTVKAIPF